MHQRWVARIVMAAIVAAAGPQLRAQAPAPLRAESAMRAAVSGYAEAAFRSYDAALQAARRFQAQVDDFVKRPAKDPDAALARLRASWVDMRAPYGRTETFRFYGGPIDFGRRADGAVGPEPLLNAWPLNEAYIDAVIDDPSAPITRAALVERNARDDEADVTTGYHAIEFLLWGRDTDPDGPGHRPARDFVGGGAAARRRQYLEVATGLLVENLRDVVDDWAPGRDNYRARFLALDLRDSVAHVLTGMATLAGFEVAAERLATPLDSNSQEDEQSCFSDTTDRDIQANVAGIADAYYGRAPGYAGPSLATAVAEVNAPVAARIDEQVATSIALAAALDRPFDRTLASPAGSARRQKVEALIAALQSLARLCKLAGMVLGVKIVVMSEIGS